MAYSLAWVRGTTGIGVIPAGTAEASTAAAGAIAASAGMAGITTAFEAADLSMKALDEAASAAVANFVGAADSTVEVDSMEVVEAFMVEGFMAEAAMATGK